MRTAFLTAMVIIALIFVWKGGARAEDPNDAAASGAKWRASGKTKGASNRCAFWPLAGEVTPAGTFAYPPVTCCFCSPRPSIPTRIVSPALRKTGLGLTPSPTPGGVPVVTTSPGSRVMQYEM
jgi:hypothetical protein